MTQTKIEARIPAGHEHGGEWVRVGTPLQSAGKIFSHIGKGDSDYEGFEKIHAADGHEYHVGQDEENPGWHVIKTKDGDTGEESWQKGIRTSPFKTRRDALSAINRRAGGKLLPKAVRTSDRSTRTPRRPPARGAVNPAFAVPEFLGNHGLPLNEPGTHKTPKYKPLGRHKRQLIPRLRKATPEDIADLEARGIKIQPAHQNIRVPSKPMTGFGAFDYMYDHHRVKDGVVLPDQKKYSQEHDLAGQESKFKRVANLQNHIGKLDDVLRRKALTDDAAAATAMMRVLGMRPSSEEGKTLVRTGETDANGKPVFVPVKTFGATTMQRQHVTMSPDGTSAKIALTGKAAHNISITTSDPFIVGLLRKRLGKKGAPTDRVFNTDSTETDNLIKSVFPDISNKDLRTYVASQIAANEVAQLPEPKNPAEFKAGVKRVTTITAHQLQHGQNMSLASYVNPQVFEGWASTAGVDFDKFARPVKGRTRQILPKES